ncbi:MAG: hypothetical protein PF495_00185, partial [Spirochaetales bacterium]|nr:hypothetical protein [Spirochaetales bacterium]
YQAVLDISLTTHQAALSAGLSEQEAMQEVYLASHQAALQSGLSEQEAVQAANLSTQEAQQKVALEGIVQEGANYRQEMELSLKETLATMELSSQERTSLGGSMADMGDEFLAQLANIQRDPNVTGDAKTAAIRTLHDLYMANLSSLSSIYGATVDWTPIVSAAPPPPPPPIPPSVRGFPRVFRVWAQRSGVPT